MVIWPPHNFLSVLVKNSLFLGHWNSLYRFAYQKFAHVCIHNLHYTHSQKKKQQQQTFPSYKCDFFSLVISCVPFFFHRLCVGDDYFWWNSIIVNDRRSLDLTNVQSGRLNYRLYSLWWNRRNHRKFYFYLILRGPWCVFFSQYANTFPPVFHAFFGIVLWNPSFTCT